MASTLSTPSYVVERLPYGIRLRARTAVSVGSWAIGLAATLDAGPAAATLGPTAAAVLLVGGGVALTVAVVMALSSPARGVLRRPRELFAGYALSNGALVLEVDGRVRPASDVRSVFCEAVAPPPPSEQQRRQRQPPPQPAPDRFAIYVVLNDEAFDLGRTKTAASADDLAQAVAQALRATATWRSCEPVRPSLVPHFAGAVISLVALAAVMGTLILPDALLHRVPEGADLDAAVIIGALSLFVVGATLSIHALFEVVVLEAAAGTARASFDLAPPRTFVALRPAAFALGALLVAGALAVLAVYPRFAVGPSDVSALATVSAPATPSEPAAVSAPVAVIVTPAPSEPETVPALPDAGGQALPAARPGLELSCAFANGWFVLVPSHLVVDGEESTDPYGENRDFFQSAALSDAWRDSAASGYDDFAHYAAQRCPREPRIVATTRGRYTLLVAHRGPAAPNGHAMAVTLEADQPEQLRFELVALDESWTCPTCD